MKNFSKEDNRQYYTAQMLQDETFMQFPKWLMTDLEFSKLSNDAKVLYTLLKDRFKLSLKNNWIDEKGRVFVICKRDSMAALLHKSKNTISKTVTELVKYKLIEDKQNGLQKPNYIYLLMPSFANVDEQKFDEDDYVEPLLITESQNLGVRNPKNWESGNAKFGSQESQELNPNKNNFNNNNSNNIDDVKARLVDKIISESSINQLKELEVSRYSPLTINKISEARHLIETIIYSLNPEDTNILSKINPDISSKMWQKSYDLVTNQQEGIYDKEAYYRVILNNTIAKQRIDAKNKNS